MIQENKLIKVFISSTFCDMDAERDVIISDVFHLVREQLEPRGITVKFVDLRWGINTQDISEEEREQQVLSECLQTIRDTRPYFVGILGDRYGWQPDAKTWNEMRTRLNDEEANQLGALFDGKNSITEFEFLVGALCIKKSLPQSIFCIRKDDVYNTMDAETRKQYCDIDLGKRARLEKLKNHISNLLNSKDLSMNLIHYSCIWDGKHISGLESFSIELAKALVRNILRFEWSDEIVSLSNDCKNAIQSDQQEIIRHTRMFIGHKDSLKEIQGTIRTDNRLHVIVSPPGFGKTAFICKLYQLQENDPSFKSFIHFSSSSPINRQPESMLLKWLSQVNEEAYKALPSGCHLRKIGYTFKTICENNPNCRYLFFIDDIQCLSDISLLSDDNWRPANSCIIATIDRSFINILKYHKDIVIHNMPLLDESNAREMIIEWLEDENRELPKVTIEQLLNKKGDSTVNSSSIPLWNIMMTKRLTSLTASDYKSMRSIPNVSDNDQITAYLQQIINEAGYVPEFLFMDFIEYLPNTEDDFSLCWEILHLIAVTENGLRSDDLRAILKDSWDELHFTRILRWLYPLVKESDNGLINFSYFCFRKIISKQSQYNDMRPYLAKVAYHLIKILDDKTIDNVACNELPRLIMIIGDGNLINKLLDKHNIPLCKSTINATLSLLNTKTHFDSIKAFTTQALDKNPAKTLQYMIDVGWKLIAQRRPETVLLYLNIAIKKYLHDSQGFDAELLLMRLMGLLVNEQPDIQRANLNLAMFIINHFHQRCYESDTWMQVFALSMLIRSRALQSMGLYQDAQEGLSMAFNKFRKFVVHKGLFQLHYPLKISFETYKENASHLPDDGSTTSLLNKMEKDVNTDVWMFKQNLDVRYKLFIFGFLMQLGEDSLGKLLFNEAERDCIQLTELEPNNITFLKTHIRTNLQKAWYQDDETVSTKNMISIQEKCRQFKENEFIDLDLQCCAWLYIHRYYQNDEDYMRDIYKNIPENLLGAEHTPSMNASIIQALCFSINDIYYFIKAVSSEWLEIAEELIIHRNSLEKAEQVLSIYESDYLNEACPPSEKLKYKTLILLTKTREMQHEIAKELFYRFMPQAESIDNEESVYITSIALCILTKMMSMDTNYEFENILDIHQVLKTLSYISADERSATIELYLLQYIYYLQMEISKRYIYTLMQSGRQNKADTVINIIRDFYNTMNCMGISGVIKTKSDYYANDALSYYYEQTGSKEKAIYHKKMALLFAEKIAKQNTGDYWASYDLACALDNYASSIEQLYNNYSKAARYSDEANRIFQRLYAHNPDSIYHDLLINATHVIRNKFQQGGAEAAIEFGESFLQKLDINVHSREAAILYDELGDMYSRLGLLVESEHYLLKAQSIFRKEQQERATNELLIRDVIINDLKLSSFYLNLLNKPKKALETILYNEKLLMQALYLNPNSSKITMLYLDFLISKGCSQLMNGSQEAITTINTFIDVCKKGITKGDIKYEHNLVLGLSRYSNTARQLGLENLMVQLYNIAKPYSQDSEAASS